MDLPKKLEQWKQAGLLDDRQIGQILHYEATAEKNHFGLYGVVALGVGVVVLGIISIIAANWNVISPTSKLISYFMLQIGLGAAYLKTAAKRSLLKEAFLYLFAFGYFAGIGLIAQIFQLSGSFWRPFAFWLVLNIGTVLVAKKRLLTHFWWIIFIITFPQVLADLIPSKEFITLNLGCLSTAFLMTGLGFTSTKIPTNLAFPFIDLARKYGFFALLVFASIGGTQLWLTPKTMLESFPSWVLGVMFLYLAAILAGFSAFVSLPRLSHNLKKALVCLFIIICLFNTFPLYWPTAAAGAVGKVGAALGFILLWFCVAWYCALLHKKRLYNLATIIIMLRFVAVYLEAFGNLLATGVGLIISGLVLLILAFLWHRYRQVLLRWMQL